jgi:hypothetical protein
MEISDAVINLAIGMLGGITGGIVTGIYTLKATDKAIKDQGEKELRHEEKEIQNMLNSIGTEITALWTFHMRRIGDHIEQLPDGEPMAFYYPLTQDYFTIYHSNAHHIGRIKSQELAEAIVVCYNKCKKVVDGFKYNNELYKAYRDLSNTPAKTPHDEARTEAALRELKDYAKFVKEDHYELKGYVEKLLELLKH